MLYKKFVLSLGKIKPVSLQSLWSDIKEAIAGSDRDFTNTSLGKAIFILAVPMILEMAMESVFAVVDIFFVSRLGADAVATVGITESVMTIVYAIGIGLSTATTALVARRVGEKKAGKAGNAAFQAIMVGLFFSLILAIPGFIFAKEFLLLMGASESMANEGYHYPMIMFGGNLVIMLLFIINAVFRSSGDAAISMRVLWMANIINLILDPLLIFGWGPFPELGIQGAAIATTIGRGIAVCYQFYLLFKGNGRIHLDVKNLSIRVKVMLKLLRLSVGGIFQYLIATSSWIILVRLVSELGADVLAGYTIAIRIIVFALLPSWGLSNAAATLVGQNLGANRPDRAEKSVWITGIVNLIMMGLIGTFILLFPEGLVRLFIEEDSVIRSGTITLQWLGAGFLFYAFGMVVVQGFNGSGDTLTPTKINLVCFWLLEIPLAYLLAMNMGMGITGIAMAIIIAESLLTIIGVILFKQGKWKLRKV
ncbi:MATE family efflux transporter [Sunxiuqinia elliptica]|uniref:Multidrug-efflux transporter n=1 Tax=Sunxiuqinia elliptica TaxID=655355 RepID=A0A1I2IRD8_9BACT|nr:MATE family efflux transporter [Sunxiuqinia elliptica]SFF44208.1 putative efflux protein, MATE family [Sunxiuqinia elliptica]